MTRSTRRGPWLPDEDQLLIQLVQSQGPNNWVRISQHMQHRSPKQCRERYHQNLKPSLNHEPISPQEGEQIEQLVNDMGKRWAEIARRLGNRSDNAVKNWWNGSMNRRKRNVLHGQPLKSIGARNEPISAARGLRLSVMSDSTRQHQCHEQDHFSRSPESSLPRFELLRATGSNIYPSYPSVEREDAHRYPQERNISILPPVTSTLPGQTSLLESSKGYGDFSRPKYLHSMLRPFEPPLPSPAVTEFSHAPSMDRAPSLISDHNSSNAISPRTVPSPRPDLPALLDTRAIGWSERRGSGSSNAPQSANPSKPFHDEGYDSAYPISATSMPRTYGEHSHHYKGHESSYYHHHHSTSDVSTSSQSQSPGSRDTRMTFSSLLNSE